MATKHQSLSFKVKAMTKEGKSVSRRIFREIEAKAKADVRTCFANLYTVTPCLHRTHSTDLLFVL